MKKPGSFVTPIPTPHRPCPAGLTASVVLVIVDEQRDGIEHILFSYIVSLGVVICFFDVIVLYTGVALT